MLSSIMRSAVNSHVFWRRVLWPFVGKRWIQREIDQRIKRLVPVKEFTLKGHPYSKIGGRNNWQIVIHHDHKTWAIISLDKGILHVYASRNGVKYHPEKDLVFIYEGVRSWKELLL